MAAIYLDTNTFIYALEHETVQAQRCSSLLRLIRDNNISAYTSELTLAEVLVRPHRTGNADLVRAYTALLGRERSIVSLQAVTRSILVESAAYRARVHANMPDPDETKRNFLPDAIHVVTAIDVGARHFVGADQRIRLSAEMTLVDPRVDSFDDFLERLA